MRSSARRERHRDADRRALLETAEQVFSRAGYAGASIRAIAADAGLSVGGVYLFFPGKDDLYLAVLEQLWDEYQAAVRPTFTETGFAGRLHAFTRASLAFFGDRSAFLSIFFTERASFSAAFHDRVAQVVERHKRLRRKQVLEIMKLGLAERALRIGDPEVLASAYLGLVSQCNMDALASRTRALPSADDLVSMFCHGVASRA